MHSKLLTDCHSFEDAVDGEGQNDDHASNGDQQLLFFRHSWFTHGRTVEAVNAVEAIAGLFSLRALHLPDLFFLFVNMRVIAGNEGVFFPIKFVK